jgi:transcriptional regulator
MARHNEVALDDAQFERIRKLRDQGLTWSVIAARFGTTKNSIQGQYARWLRRRDGKPEQA